MSRSGIVCTIGPQCCTRESLVELRQAGMTVARLNGSHADLDWHANAIALIHAAVPEVPILLDIPGRKIRTKQLAHEPRFAAGDEIVLTTDDAHDGSEKVPVTYASLHEDLSPGDRILADDGTLGFTVLAIEGCDLRCRCDTNGVLKSGKGINVPHVQLRTDVVTDRDRHMVAFALEHGVDYVGVSFVESREHVAAVRALGGEKGLRIVAKIENQGGLDNAEEVIDEADAIMIDRGDLAVETSVERVSVFQKQILEHARKLGKPVIVATEMLHSMIHSPVPTKAEVSDITNAVLDGCAATMLSGETAVGVHPRLAVETMRRVSDAAQAYWHQGLLDGQFVRPPPSRAGSLALVEAVAAVGRSLPITKIIAITVSGYAARMIAATRPEQTILAVSNDAATARSLNLLFGTTGVHVDIPFDRTSTDHIPVCLKHLWLLNHVCEDDVLLVTALAYPSAGRRMNLVQTHHVTDLVSAFGWTRGGV